MLQVTSNYVPTEKYSAMKQSWQCVIKHIFIAQQNNSKIHFEGYLIQQVRKSLTMFECKKATGTNVQVKNKLHWLLLYKYEQKVAQIFNKYHTN